ncbi:MAG: hypothetical protein JW976_06040 [Syntrophaceae bacterium]|nr:hypothetical protein [Syntrophaceae bacterium]
MRTDIENVAEEKGKNIAKKIIEKYGKSLILGRKSFFASFLDRFLDGGYSYLKVDKEIYERSLQEATSFFSTNENAKLDNKVMETLQSRLEKKLQNPDEVKIMTAEEMLAMLIKIYVSDSLFEEVRNSIK